jgi:hypothetical protein
MQLCPQVRIRARLHWVCPTLCADRDSRAQDEVDGRPRYSDLARYRCFDEQLPYLPL